MMTQAGAEVSAAADPDIIISGQGGYSTLKQYRTRAMKTKTCPDCNGDGVVDKGTDDEHQCPMCGGSGVVPDDDDSRVTSSRSDTRHSAIQF
jgi:DnaJ-class molecular chaperone